MFPLVISSCSCDEEYDDPKFDSFPSAGQIWGMLGTIFVVAAFWLLRTKVCLNVQLASLTR